MIADLKIIDDDTAEAVGKKFDVARILEATCGFLDRFAAAIRAAVPGTPATLRFNGDGDRIAPLDADGFARLRRETLAYAKSWNVVAHGATVDSGPFRLKVFPLGRDDLHRNGSAAPTLIDESPWHDLDPTPVIEFLPLGSMPIFPPRTLTLLRDLIAINALVPPGAKLDFDRIPALRFPHEAFGAGLGILNISLLTIPVGP